MDKGNIASLEGGVEEKIANMTLLEGPILRIQVTDDETALPSVTTADLLAYANQL